MKIVLSIIEIIAFMSLEIMLIYAFIQSIIREKEQKKINKQFLNNLELEAKILNEQFNTIKPIKKVGRPKKTINNKK